VKGFKAGDPLADGTYIGPLTRAPQLEVLEAQVGDAVAKGRKARAGGKRVARAGNWFEPTVLTGVDHTMAVMRDESFGPIIGIQKVASDDEALALMNDTRYGLTAGVYTRDEARAAKLLARVNAGSVYWNCCDRVSPRLPWSGHGDSGVGVTLSTYGIQAFTRRAPGTCARLERRPRATASAAAAAAGAVRPRRHAARRRHRCPVVRVPDRRGRSRPRDLRREEREVADRYGRGEITPAEFAGFYAATLAGRAPAEWSPLRQRFVARAIAPRIGAASLALVAARRAAGDRLVLTTATNRFLTAPIATLLGITDLVATELEVAASGDFTGRTAGIVNMREGKVTRLARWLGDERLAASSLATATFYSDSINDLPLLCAVGTPVVVDPDSRLQAEAARRGWPVISLLG
jgi:HAD superfamily hydrolase (TIGR01490 family)